MHQFSTVLATEKMTLVVLAKDTVVVLSDGSVVLTCKLLVFDLPKAMHKQAVVMCELMRCTIGHC